jgi:hypothetical protein
LLRSNPTSVAQRRLALNAGHFENDQISTWRSLSAYTRVFVRVLTLCIFLCCNAGAQVLASPQDAALLRRKRAAASTHRA